MIKNIFLGNVHSTGITGDKLHQGTNARKVISEEYAFFELQCTVFGRKSKHNTDVDA